MILVQVIGIVALLLDIASVQFKFRKTILSVQILASITWVVHFLLLGAISGAVMNSVGVLRSVSYFKFQTEPRPFWLPWAIGSVAVIASIFTWQGVVSLLPLIAMLLAIYGLWQKDEQKIRICLLLCIPLWFAYNLIFMSYAGMASDVLALVSGLIALWRYRKDRTKSVPIPHHSAHAVR